MKREGESREQWRLIQLRSDEVVSNSGTIHQIPETMRFDSDFKEVSMKNNSISRMLMAVTPTMIVCVVLALGSSAAAQAPIQGSWIFTLTPPPGGPPPFSAVVSFAAGGVFLATGQNDRAVAPVSELHGTWERIPGNRYGSTTYMIAFDSAGIATGMLQTNQVFQLTGKDTLVGSANLNLCDLQGENCVPIPGVSQVTGKRMVLVNQPPL